MGFTFLLNCKNLEPRRESADSYVKRVGPHQAKLNASAVINQAESGFRSKYWEQVLRIAEKQLEPAA